MDKKIGVIIPVHNSSQTLDRCLESIVCQTYKNLMIILVENGSQDNSLELCKLWVKKDDRIIVLQSEKGVSKARNKGIDAALSAECDYIAFCDSDDYIKDAMYESLLEIANTNSSDLVFCNYIERYTDKNVVQRITEKAKKSLRRKDLTPLFYHNRDAMMGVVWRSLFSSKLCRKISFKENIVVAEDLIYIIEAIQEANRINFCDEVLYFYTVPTNLIRKYNSEDRNKERSDFFGYMEKILSGRNKKFLSFLRVGTLIDRITAIIKSDKNYHDSIKHLYSIDFYKMCRNTRGFMQQFLHGRRTLRSKISLCVLYFGFYDFYAKHMKKE